MEPSGPVQGLALTLSLPCLISHQIPHTNLVLPILNEVTVTQTKA